MLPSPSLDLSGFVSEEVSVPSTGGVVVPLSIVHRRGLKLNGTAPTWLSVYGSYGLSSEARFEPRRIAWLESGGIYAVCHARGGGEHGEPWHRAGMKQNKQNTIDDALACARYLIEHKYTATAHLGIEGTSAGGLAAGGALTQHPELFGAAILRVPLVDPIGFERSAGGEINAKEFGSVKVRDEFGPLLAMSPYNGVRDGVRYPAVLLMTSENDQRVPMSQAAKMAARLQAASKSGKPVLLRVATDAGHGIVGATRTQIDAELADIYAFLSWQLGGRPIAAKH
jgi:prolyl oligopeptidase